MKNLRDYDPNGPYVIKSGKRKNKALEVLMFNDYGFLRWHYSELERKYSSNRGRNNYHRHLIWVLRRGENRQPKMDCPICGENRLEYFSVRYSRGTDLFSVGPQHTSCESCKGKIANRSSGGDLRLYQPKFSNIVKITSKKGDQKRIADLYRSIFKLEGRLTKQKAFNFFKED